MMMMMSPYIITSFGPPLLKQGSLKDGDIGTDDDDDDDVDCRE